MYQRQRPRVLDKSSIEQYMGFLREQEKSPATIQKYRRDITAAAIALTGIELTKAALIEWKERLIERYAASSVNTILASINGFLKFMGWADLTLKAVKVQRAMFSNEKRELTQEDYRRLVQAAERSDNRRLSMVIQTICSTGIRVSELQFITVEAVRQGHTEIDNKGKRRPVLLPSKLRKSLLLYMKENNISSGPIFVTRGGKPLDRSNIWRDMKRLCEYAGVDPEKVFPHNLRHLFARTYYALERDLSRLADILGHSNINTTRIYTKESNLAHIRQLDRLGFVIT